MQIVSCWLGTMGSDCRPIVPWRLMGLAQTGLAQTGSAQTDLAQTGSAEAGGTVCQFFGIINCLCWGYGWLGQLQHCYSAPTVAAADISTLQGNKPCPQCQVPIYR